MSQQSREQKIALLKAIAEIGAIGLFALNKYINSLENNESSECISTDDLFKKNLYDFDIFSPHPKIESKVYGNGKNETFNIDPQIRYEK